MSRDVLCPCCGEYIGEIGNLTECPVCGYVIIVEESKEE